MKVERHKKIIIIEAEKCSAECAKTQRGSPFNKDKPLGAKS
ncbi:MAG: hypothetical protein ACI9IT_001617 [Glaciecola sp.]|jgi:hypothetical protein